MLWEFLNKCAIIVTILSGIALLYGLWRWLNRFEKARTVLHKFTPARFPEGIRQIRINLENGAYTIAAIESINQIEQALRKLFRDNLTRLEEADRLRFQEAEQKIGRGKKGVRDFTLNQLVTLFNRSRFIRAWAKISSHPLPERLGTIKLERLGSRKKELMQNRRADRAEAEQLLHSLRVLLEDFGFLSPEGARQAFSAPLSRKFPVKWLLAGILLALPLLGYLLTFPDPKLQSHLKAAHAFLNDDQFQAAREEYEKARKLAPDNAKAVHGLEKTAIYADMADGEYDTAIISKQIAALLERQPDDPHLLVLWGNLYAESEPEKAKDRYQKALENDSDVASAWFGLGVVHHQQGKLDKAIAMTRKAAALSEFNRRYLDNLAFFYQENGQEKKALETYDRLLQTNPNFLLAYCEIAHLHGRMGQLDKARRYQETLVKRLEDKRVASLPQNRSLWYFPCQNQPVYLRDLADKKYYAYLSLAATRYLTHSTPKAAAGLIQKAGALEPHIQGDNTAIIALVEWQLKQIRERFPRFREKADGFLTEFLSNAPAGEPKAKI